MIGGFRSLLCVSVFKGSLLVIVIVIDGSDKRMFVKSAVSYVQTDSTTPNIVGPTMLGVVA